ncbi:hypothetical protein EVC24_015 [Rhizobium phage RHph_I4]|nr:hypothetical protein EVC24_015 [Rhizobium phage RHph_I4]
MDLRALTNRELSALFQHFLTHGAKEALGPEILAATKDWRGDLWKVFKEVDDRLCPTPEKYRRRNEDHNF